MKLAGNSTARAYLASLSVGIVLLCLLQASSAETDKPAPAPLESATSSGAKVMAPDQFFGEAAAAYQAAQECPEICAKLFCYCGCDETDKHTSLLDCFTSDHGADCQICAGEVFLALAMKKQGRSLAEIQRAVDEKYVKEYPFDNPSVQLKAYRSSRLWHPSQPEQMAPPGSKNSGPTSSPPPKLKPGKKIGSCCGGGKQP